MNAQWQLNDGMGRVHTPRFAARCGVAFPTEGIHAISVDGSAYDARLLGPTLDGSLLEAFARGGDLAAIYAPTEAFPFRTQAYWRVDSHPLRCDDREAILAIELVASTQTDLLDSRPEISVGSRLPVESAWSLNADLSEFVQLDLTTAEVELTSRNWAGCNVTRLPGSTLSYVEMVYPLDFERTSLSFATRGTERIVTASHRLFAHRLEKGVVLRARVLGLWLDRAEDLLAALAHYREFAASEIPLTA